MSDTNLREPDAMKPDNYLITWMGQTRTLREWGKYLDLAIADVILLPHTKPKEKPAMMKITRSSTPIESPVLLRNLSPGEIFIFVPGSSVGGGKKDSPCIMSDEGSFLYLNTGVEHSVAGTTGVRHVKRIVAEMTW